MTNLAAYLDPRVIQRVSRLDLRARFIVEGFLAGLHASPFHGFSVEFSEHRKYAAGDEPRSVDWKVFARTDRLYVRRFEAETHLACLMLVDASASMGYVGPLDAQPPEATAANESSGGPTPPSAGVTGPMTKLNYCIHIAAALGYLLHKQRDAIGLGVVQRELTRFVPPRSRPGHLMNLLAALAATRPEGDTGIARAVAQALTLVPHRGLVVIMSDLLTATDDTLQALHNIRYRGHDLIVMHVLDAAEAVFPFSGSVRLEDPETGEVLTLDAGAVRERYAEALEAWRGELRAKIGGLRADYVPLDTGRSFDQALTEFLIRRARRRG